MAATREDEKIRIVLSDCADGAGQSSRSIKLVYVLEGELDVQIGNQEFHIGQADLLLINAGTEYRLTSQSPVFYAELLISYTDFCAETGSTSLLFWCNPSLETTQNYKDLQQLVRMLLQQYVKQDEASMLHYRALCYQIMYVLSAHFRIVGGSQEFSDKTEKYNERINEINRYIELNYERHISIQELSKHLFLSEGYLSRFFKNNYGMNFSDYLTSVRLRHATEDLLYTDKSVTAVAYDNGFSNAAAFNKAFRETCQKTPSAFREDNPTEERRVLSMEDPSAKKRLESELGEELYAAFEWSGMLRDTGVITSEHAAPLIPYWNRTLNAGSAEDLLQSELRDQIVLLKSILHFEYVRIWNPFVQSMLIDMEGMGQKYNFSRLDVILDFLVDQGLKAHFVPYSKNVKVSKNMIEHVYFREMKHEESIGQWECLIEAFMEHILQRYSRQVIENWRIELWDTNDSVWLDEGKTAWYFEFYQRIYRIIKKYSPAMEVGGCGILTCNFPTVTSQYIAFYEKWKRADIHMDFFATMIYPYLAEGMTAKKAINSDFVRSCVEAVLRDIQTFGLNVGKLYVTEWGLSISERNWINDSCFKGAYVLKNYIDVYGETEDMAYYQGSDYGSEYFDTDTLLYGGNGLITKDGILKPAGFALAFLSRLYPVFLGKGEHYIATTDGKDTYGIVCHNCKDLGLSYLNTKEDKLDRQNLSKYFADNSALHLNLQIRDMENGLYQAKVYRINEQNGSVLDLWGEMEYQKNLSPNDIRYLRGTCEPKLSVRHREVTDGSMDINIQLLPNEIAFIQLMRDYG